MAKRLAAETPYTPLDDSLLKFVLQPPEPGPDSSEQALSPAATSLPAAEERSHTERKVTRRRIASRQEKTFEARSVTRAPDVEPGGEQVPRGAAAFEPMSAVLRLKSSVREKREFEAFVARLAAALDTTLKPSNVLRALVSVVQHSEGAISDIAPRHGPFRRPPNDDAIAYADFELRLVKLLDAAIKQSIPLR